MIPDRAELLRFAGEMAAECRALGREPIVSGSAAVLAHTGDAALQLGDVDFLAPEACFAELAARCGRDNVELTSYHTLKLARGSLRVSFDSEAHYLADIAARPAFQDVAGVRFLVLDRFALIEAYRRGAEAIAAKRADYLAKLRLLAD